MRRIVCQSCGSASMGKNNGLYECQSCGTKYLLSEYESSCQENIYFTIYTDDKTDEKMINIESITVYNFDKDLNCIPDMEKFSKRIMFKDSIMPLEEFISDNVYKNIKKLINNPIHIITYMNPEDLQSYCDLMVVFGREYCNMEYMDLDIEEGDYYFELDND